MENTMIKHPRTELNIIAVPSLQRIDFINLDDILYFKADGRYTYIHLSDDTVILSVKNLGEYQSIIENPHFFRIHNSYIINLMHIIAIDKSGGNYCLLTNGTKLPISKRKNKDLCTFLKI